MPHGNGTAHTNTYVSVGSYYLYSNDHYLIRKGTCTITVMKVYYH